ncbi:hypothetical protein ACFLT1_06510 [Bacteroidota bacterium]
MNELLNKLMMYHQIHKMHRAGWKISRIASFLVLNRRTVSKYLEMTEQEFLDYQSGLHSRKSELDPYQIPNPTLQPVTKQDIASELFFMVSD